MKSIVLTVLGFTVLTGCQGPGINPEERNAHWTMVRLELDPAHIGNAGTMPIFTDSDGALGAGAPRAKGSLRINDFGKIACQVSVFEPVMGLSGSRSIIEHSLLRFFGRSSDDGRRFLLEDRTSSADYPLGVATELQVERDRDDTLRIRALTGERPLPYIFVFQSGARPAPPIHVPYVPRR